MSDFLYDINTIPVVHNSPDNLQLSAFRNLVKLTDGGNSNIYTSFYTEVNANVVIKVIKQEKMHDVMVINEFELEYQLLIRLDHPNIIKTYGRGVTADKRFIVLEYLEGGTMQKVLETKSNERRNIFGRTSRFTYEEVLQQGIQLADALNYLHSKVVINKACIIHRDLKPDNIGYSSDGTLKLRDFGLSTCVRTRTNDFETYAMAGFTGSLRYMAPEVVRSEAYTEKVDVYGFGLLLYQLITNKLPYNGMNKETLIEQVINNNQRPKIRQYIPSPFFDLLTLCWHHDPNIRPSFEVIMTELVALSLPTVD